jgi:hypothetical protein
MFSEAQFGILEHLVKFASDSGRMMSKEEGIGLLLVSRQSAPNAVAL